jgi:hypothetical protein
MEILRRHVIVLLGLGAVMMATRQLGFDTLTYWCFYLSAFVLGSTVTFAVIIFVRWAFGMDSSQQSTCE